MSAATPQYQSQILATWSPLIGRDQDIKALEHCLPQQRLVTLWGPGGSGKTRLAMQVTQQLAGSFADGARFVACADLHDPNLLLLHVATALGLHVQDERVPQDALIAWLCSRHLLLVIDNCEHLLDACTKLVGVLLAACPHLHVLMTSRELLNLPTEQAYQVRPLTLPPPERVHGLHGHAFSSLHQENLEAWEDVGTYGAIQFFVQRVQMAQPDFALTRENAPLIIRICWLLDGLPLAIELAAARVRMLALEQLADRLAQGIAILGAGNRLAPARQQTLQATITWSYQLLTPPEQQLFRRLALATGTFDLSLVEALGEGIAGMPGDVVDLLAHLIDKSLVTVVTLEGTARYCLLDTLRHYGREQVQQLGETQSVYQIYSGWVRRLTERAEFELQGPRQSAWLDRLEAEIEHIRTVIRWLLQHGEAAEVVRISAALVAFCELRPHAREATQWLEAALAGAGAIESVREAKALRALGMLYIRQDQADQTQGYLTQAQEYLTQARDRYTQLDDQDGVASTFYHLGYVAYWQADYHAAKAGFEAGLAIVPKEAQNLQAGLLHRLALAQGELGERQQAHHLYLQSLAVRRQIADVRGQALTLACLGEVLNDQGDYAQSQQYLRESLQLCEDLGYRDGYLLALVNLYDVALALKDPSLTQDYLAIALSSTWGECQIWVLAELFGHLARMALLQRRPLQAAQLFGFTAMLNHERSDQLPDSIGVQLQQLTPQVREKNAWLAPYSAAWREGQRMGLEEAFSFALHGSGPGVNEQESAEQRDAREAEAVSTTSSTTVSTTTTPQLTIAPLRIAAFGGGNISRNDGQAGVTWHYSKARELFFYLVDSSHRTKGQICLALWPDAAEEQASTHMHVTMYHLRKTLGDAAWVLRTNAAYAFNRRSPYWYDVEEFEAQITQAQALKERQQTLDTLEAQEEDESIIGLLAGACALYRGEYLADLPPQEWILQRQTELQRHYTDAQYRLGKAYQRQGDGQQALACYQAVTACDPYHEQAHAAILQCYVALGQRSQAIRYYRELQQYLRDELGVTPDPHITAFVRTLLTQTGAAS